jgi:hypothetical protein
VKKPVAGSERDELLPRDWAELGPLVDQVLDAARSSGGADRPAAGDPIASALGQLAADMSATCRLNRGSGS